MKFRPCIDIHNGVVKQIVGSTLSETTSTEEQLVENFVATKSAGEYARMYSEDALTGGHVIMLGAGCEAAALEALKEYPMGLQIGGGITSANALMYLEAGASHVIVTSYVFQDGKIQFDRLEELVSVAGKDRLVIDLSCRRLRDDPSNELYYVVTNKWTKYTDFPITTENISKLSQYCDEFLVHGVDVEGKRCGIEENLVKLLATICSIPVTYAGGIRSIDDVRLIGVLGDGRVDYTVGSALDIFGGDLPYTEIVAFHKEPCI